MNKAIKFFSVFLLISLLVSSFAFARKKGNIHYHAKCRECSCSEFVSDMDSRYKCYNCGHADYMHKR